MVHSGDSKATARQREGQCGSSKRIASIYLRREEVLRLTLHEDVLRKFLQRVDVGDSRVRQVKHQTSFSSATLRIRQIERVGRFLPALPPNAARLDAKAA